MNLKVCLLVGLCLLVVAPFVSAEPGDSAEPTASAGTKCVDVDPNNTPPVEIYECPWSTNP